MNVMTMTANMQQMLEMVERIGLRGEDAIQFIREQQEMARSERLEQREEAERRREEQREEAERQRQHELEILRRQELPGHERNDQQNRNSKSPKLPVFNESTDMMDSYLQRFERFAQANNWNRDNWATSLSALLTGKALDVYSRLSDDAAVDYDMLKSALLKRYNLTEEGYREKFRKCKPEPEESPEQYVYRVKTYLEKWIELSEVDSTFEGLRDLIVKEQVIDACSKDLAVYLQERSPRDLGELAKFAEQYLKAHGKQLHQSDKKPWKVKPSDQTRTSEDQERSCFNCKKPGHKAFECKQPKTSSGKPEVKCYGCGKVGHKQNECRGRSTRAAAAVQGDQREQSSEQEYGAGCIMHPAPLPVDILPEINECIKDNVLQLAMENPSKL